MYGNSMKQPCTHRAFLTVMDWVPGNPQSRLRTDHDPHDWKPLGGGSTDLAVERSLESIGFGECEIPGSVLRWDLLSLMTS